MYVWDSNRYAQTVNALISLECGPGTSRGKLVLGLHTLGWAVAFQILSQEGLAVLSLSWGFLGALPHSHLWCDRESSRTLPCTVSLKF